MEKSRFGKYLKVTGYFLLGLFALILIAFLTAKLYFESNKAEMTQKLNKVINDNIEGEIHIGAIEVKTLAGFPNLTLALKDVEIKDKFWDTHKRTFLKAGEIQAGVSFASILRKKISVREIFIKDAKIDSYTGTNGLSNSNIFKTGKKEDLESDSAQKIDKVIMKNVALILDNRQKKKLYHFEVISAKAKFNNKFNDDWQTDLAIKVFVKSMTFKTEKGSFSKNQMIEGVLKADYSKKKKKIDVVSNDLKIGKDLFDIKAFFNIGKDNTLYRLDIRTNILWRNATALLTDNISVKLNKFNLLKPLKTKCVIIGHRNVRGNPQIVVNADIADNELSVPDGLIKKCSFHGKFSNNYEKGKQRNDANSEIILTNFTGTYQNVPFKLPFISIKDLKNPMAIGKVKSRFKFTDLNKIMNDKIISFQKGDASVNLDFKVDIDHLKLHKPHFNGKVAVKDASFIYEPKNLKVEDNDILLDFTPERLNVEKIRIQKDKSIINMNFTIDNYSNFLYDDPSEILINGNVYSPYIDMKQMLGLFIRKKKVAVKKGSKNVSVKLFSVLEKCQVKLIMKAEKMKYNHLMGSQGNAVIKYKDKELFISDGRLSGFDGSIIFSGMLMPVKNNFQLMAKVDVSNVNISKFLRGFDNFGITSFSPQNIKGSLSLQSDLKYKITSSGKLISNSLSGKVAFSVKNGALQNFPPLKNLGKFMPNRDFNNVALHELEGTLYADKGEINVDKLRLSSSIVNMDIAGIYSFDRNTNLKVTIPLRNPKDDYKIKNTAEREKIAL